jgi:hypothetical protein
MQGELARKGAAQQLTYKNPFQALAFILQHEGPSALGKGLLPAYGAPLQAELCPHTRRRHVAGGGLPCRHAVLRAVIVGRVPPPLLFSHRLPHCER